MATGLFDRHARDGRATADEQLTSTDAAASDERAATQDRPARTATQERLTPTTAPARTGRHPLAADQPPVPPGGAVAPVAPPPPSADLDRARAQRDLDQADRDRAVAEHERAAEPATAPTTEPPVEPAAEPAPEPKRWVHSSVTATIGLIIGVTAVLAALSGRLAPVAVAAGTIGVLFAGSGLAAVTRRHVTGHHVALLALAFNIAGVVLGILAIFKTAPWLNSQVDQAGQVRDWLDAHLPWMTRW
jgi:hypothetical protein